MSHAAGRTLIALTTVVALGTVALAPSSASARGRGGFGFGFGVGAIAAASAPVYVQPQPRVVVAPTVTSERRRHKEARHEPQTPKHPVVTRTIAKPTETEDTVAHDADQRKCLTKEYMADRSVVFKDTCTQEQASVPRSAPAAPQSPQVQVSTSVVLEPAGANDDMPQQMDGP